MELVIAGGAILFVLVILVVALIGRAATSHSFNKLLETEPSTVATVVDGEHVVVAGRLEPAGGAPVETVLGSTTALYTCAEIWYRAHRWGVRTLAQEMVLRDDTGLARIRLDGSSEVRGRRLDGKLTGDEVPDWLIAFLAERGLHFEGTPSRVDVHEQALLPGDTVVVSGRARREPGDALVEVRATAEDPVIVALATGSSE